MEYILFLNVGMAAAMLLYTSFLDIKKREVEDKVWIIFGGAAAVLQAYEFWIGVNSLTLLAVALVLATVIGMGLFFFGFYGGADGKALIVLAAILPSFQPAVGLYQIAPLIVLTNGVLISICLPAAMLALNGWRIVRKEPIFEGFENESFGRKVLACLLGYKQLGKPREFQFTMEKPIVQGKTGTENSRGADHETTVGKRFDFSLMRDEFVNEAGTWVTPGIPLLVFFTMGFFALLLYGDLVIGLIRFLFGLFAI